MEEREGWIAVKIVDFLVKTVEDRGIESQGDGHVKKVSRDEERTIFFPPVLGLICVVRGAVKVNEPAVTVGLVIKQQGVLSSVVITVGLAIESWVIDEKDEEESFHFLIRFIVLPVGCFLTRLNNSAIRVENLDRRVELILVQGSTIREVVLLLVEGITSISVCSNLFTEEQLKKTNCHLVLIWVLKGFGNVVWSSVSTATSNLPRKVSDFREIICSVDNFITELITAVIVNFATDDPKHGPEPIADMNEPCLVDHQEIVEVFWLRY